MLHEETVAPETLALIRRLSADRMLQDFVLVGGTALALQLGHRKSVDIDLFGSKEFDGVKMAKHLEMGYKAEVHTAERNNVFSWINDIQLTLISHRYPMIAPLLTAEGVKMASLDDIGAMKMHSIFNSGRRLKDFVDMYYILEHRSLEDITRAYSAKYPDRNISLAISSLLYHGEIRKEAPLDLLLRPFDLEEITARLHKAVAKPREVFQYAVGKEKKIGDQDLSAPTIQKRKGKRL